MNELQELGTELLLILHRSMDWNVWGSKRLKYWDVFQENVAAAAYTRSLAKWLCTFCSRMSIPTPGRTEVERRRLDEILNGGQDRALLKTLREETQLLVLAVRVRQQEKKEARAAASSEDEEMELAALSPETGQPLLEEREG